MIVRNEANNLPACLFAVSKLFDEIIIVDTGSTDSTKRIARRHGAKVFDSTWQDDFSAARNETLRHATGEYIFWLDADDRIDAANAKLLDALFKSLDGSRMVYMMATVCKLSGRASAPLNGVHPRLFHAHAEARWQHRIHEQILPCLEQLGFGVVETEIVIRHTGYQDAVLTRRKLNRDLKLCRLDYATAPQDPVVLHHFGTALLQLGQFSVALQYLLKCLQFAREAPWIVMVYAQVVSLLEALKQKPRARQLALDGLAQFPGDYQLSLMAVTFYLDEGEIGLAEQTLRAALGEPVRGYLESSRNNRLLHSEIRRVLARIYVEQRRFDESESLLQQILAEQAGSLFAWVTLAYSYVAKQSWSQVQFVIRKMSELPHGRPYVCCLEAEILKGRGEAEAAIPWLRQAIKAAPDMALPRMLMLEAVTATRAGIDERRQAASEVLRLCPGDAVAQRTLIELERFSGISVPFVVSASAGHSVSANS